MPASPFRPRCHFVFTLLAVMLFVCARVEAQTGSVTMTATVSETVALSISPSFNPQKLTSDVVRTGNTVRVTLSDVGAATRGETPVVRIPLLVRSNTDFKISARIDSTTAVVNDLSVVDVRATGKLVSPPAARAIDVERQFDPSDPLLVLTGPRVSLGGTLESPNNALQITLLIRLQPQPNRAWSLQLTFVGAPE